MAGRCSELAALLSELAKFHVSEGATTVDEVVEQMQHTLPDIDRTRLVDSLIEVANANKIELAKFQKDLAKVKREARTDKDLRDKIAELESALAENTLPSKKPRTAPERTEAIQKLHDAKNKLVKELKKSDAAQRQKLGTQVEKAYQRLADTGIRQPDTTEEGLPQTKELQELIAEKDRVQRQIRNKIEKARPKTVWEKGLDWGNSLRSLMTTGEFSGVLRQGKMAVFTDPKGGLKATQEMLRTFMNPARIAWLQRKWDQDLDVQHWIKAGLAVQDIGGPINQQEDAIMAPMAGQWRDTFLGRVQGVRQLAELKDRFDQSYMTFLNSLRINVAKSVSQYVVDGEPTIAERQSIARIVNVMSGRGSLGQFESSAAALNAGMFSPRYQMSRIQTLIGQPIWKAEPHLRGKLLTRFYGRNIIGMGAMYMLYSLAFGREKEFSLTFNPLTSDFGKLVMGRTRLDPLSGLSQPIVFLNRAVRGKRVSLTGKETPLREEVIPGKKVPIWEKGVVAPFVRGKLAPLPSLAWDSIEGENVIGEPQTVGGTILNLATPITYRDIYETMTSELSVPSKMAAAALSFFGEGVSTYAERPKKVSKKKSKRK